MPCLHVRERPTDQTRAKEDLGYMLKNMREGTSVGRGLTSSETILYIANTNDEDTTGG